MGWMEGFDGINISLRCGTAEFDWGSVEFGVSVQMGFRGEQMFMWRGERCLV